MGYPAGGGPQTYHTQGGPGGNVTHVHNDGGGSAMTGFVGGMLVGEAIADSHHYGGGYEGGGGYGGGGDYGGGGYDGGGGGDAGFDADG